MIAILNYGLGNVKAFANIYHYLNIPFTIANDSNTLKQASKIILPGVGSFDFAVKQLMRSGMHCVLEESVLQKNIPILGVCIGMHVLARKSEEGTMTGLGWIDGVVKKFEKKQRYQLLRLVVLVRCKILRN